MLGAYTGFVDEYLTHVVGSETLATYTHEKLMGVDVVGGAGGVAGAIAAVGTVDPLGFWGRRGLKFTRCHWV